MKKIALVSVAALGLSLAACGSADTPQEEAAEAQGDAMVDQVETEANAMEDANQITDDQADAMVDQAEAEADMMEADAEAQAPN